MNHNHHKLFIGLTGVIVLVISTLYGTYFIASFAPNIDILNLQIFNLGMMFTLTLLLLMNMGIMLEMREELCKKKRKNRKK